MACLPQAERIETRQQRLDRYAISNQTVTEFCKSEGVSVPSFYQWKRRLSTPHRDATAARKKTPHQGEAESDKAAAKPFTEIVVTGELAIAKALLPNGVSISLGGDQTIAAAIVDRLLAYEPATASGRSTPNSGARRSSC